MVNFKIKKKKKKESVFKYLTLNDICTFIFREPLHLLWSSTHLWSTTIHMFTHGGAMV